MHQAELVFSFPPPIARAIHGALAPETDAQVPKTRSRALLDAGGMRIHVHADDLPSLRAAVNSYARWIDAGERAARLAR